MIDEALRVFLLEHPTVVEWIGDRIYPAPLGDRGELPAITYLDISAANSYSNDGVDCLVRVLYQIDHWAPTLTDARLVEAATSAVLNGFRGSWTGGIRVGGAFRANRQTLYEPETQLWRVVVDYRINAMGE